MDAQVVLRKLIEMAGGPAERGHVLALAGEGLQSLPDTLTTSVTTYTVVQPTTEIGLRHYLWKAAGAPLVAVLDEALARKLPADLIRTARGGRVHAVEPSEVLSLALRVPVTPLADVEVQRLAIENVDRIRALLDDRTLPTVVDGELLDELLLDVVIGGRLRRETPGQILAAWLRDTPEWTAAVRQLVERQLPRIHGLAGQILAWAIDQKKLDEIVVRGSVLALEEDELPASIWGQHLGDLHKRLDVGPATVRQALAQIARDALDALGADAARFLEKADSIARRHLTPAVQARSLILPLGLDVLCDEVAQRAVRGEAVPHDLILRMRRHRSAIMRSDEIEVLEEVARLSRWLATPSTHGGATVLERVRGYQRQGAFADWCVARLQSGLAKSLAFRKQAETLVERWRKRRDEENLSFAELLAADYTKAVHAEGVVPLHRVWRNPPLRPAPGEQRRTYLVVLDGCSYPVFLRLVSELAGDKQPLGLRFDPVTREAAGTPALAPIPTITSHARSALFLGEVPKDPWIAETVWRESKEAATDPARFKQNASLGERTRRLFLKGDLSDGGHALDEALRDGSLDVVAAVFNAVDDQIGSSNTGAAVSVKAAEISGLLPSLRAALLANRGVVVTADHGHTPFAGKALRVGDGASARYRELSPGESAPEGFIEIAHDGLGGGPGRKAFAWKMGVYQGQPQVGFHGGCSLEEMVVPLAELVSSGVAADEPGWWFDGVVTPPAAEAEPRFVVPPAAAPTAPKPPQGDLFDRTPFRGAILDKAGIPAAVRALLDDSEQAALACVYESKSARASDIAGKLGRPRSRMSGLMARLVNKLHDAGFPCLRRTTLPNGEDQYTWVPQGTEGT